MNFLTQEYEIFKNWIEAEIAKLHAHAAVVSNAAARSGISVPIPPPPEAAPTAGTVPAPAAAPGATDAATLDFLSRAGMPVTEGSSPTGDVKNPDGTITPGYVAGNASADSSPLGAGGGGGPGTVGVLQPVGNFLPPVDSGTYPMPYYTTTSTGNPAFQMLPGATVALELDQSKMLQFQASGLATFQAFQFGGCELEMCISDNNDLTDFPAQVPSKDDPTKMVTNYAHKIGGGMGVNIYGARPDMPEVATQAAMDYNQRFPMGTKLYWKIRLAAGSAPPPGGLISGWPFAY